MTVDGNAAAREQQLVAFIREYLSSDPSKPNEIDEPLITSGLVDSFSLGEVLTFIDEEWGVQIPDQEATVRQFDTVSKIMQVVGRYGD